MLRLGMGHVAHSRLWTFEYLGTPMLGTEKTLSAELTHVYQNYEMDVTGTVYSFCLQ